MIINRINSYGYYEYPNKLQKEIDRLNIEKLRIIEEKLNEDNEIEEYKEKMEDKSIDENFHKINNLLNNTKNFLQTFEYFDK